MLIVIGSKVLEVNRGGESRWSQSLQVRMTQKESLDQSCPENIPHEKYSWRIFGASKKTEHIVVKQRQIHDHP